ncbi:hypothetical protein VSS74_20430 [Conexibacter stalactiti]|uniref:Uncharacterized protein n=1 Tax=Conexibacter stalactiti TaxID=1940611 RepID=A0ABU4HU49_9ACTN|nr:hypothetical protein [Conexibacter stalactiti]MDW5596724.1 hypothetical protein [Conexibacter stalactiti]MEC5037366.1 hypothetical protein [Conexibacter stalactiti]
MFSSRAPKLIGAALMDLAEAMLRPVDDEELERTDRASDDVSAIAHPRADRRRASTPAPQLRTRLASTSDDWFTELPFAPELGRPHRREARLERRRRPGTIARPVQPCSSPLSPKPATAVPRAGS